MQPASPPSVPSCNLLGFSQVTAILSFVANKPLHMGGAYRIR